MITLNGFQEEPSRPELPPMNLSGMPPFLAEFFQYMETEAHKDQMRDAFVGIVMCTYHEIVRMNPMEIPAHVEFVKNFIERVLWDVEKRSGYESRYPDGPLGFEEYRLGLQMSSLEPNSHMNHDVPEMRERLTAILEGIKP
ncbi:MAG TPA: hypothetical protein VFO86_10990 [Terriglobia bacterium]|nr:hypothetical protein [Terriglobia bacterium]